jgi:hypothetical protein
VKRPASGAAALAYARAVVASDWSLLAHGQNDAARRRKGSAQRRGGFASRRALA